MHTAIKSLVLAARSHGIDLSADRLIHDYSLTSAEPSPTLLLRIAAENGMRAKPVSMTWADFGKIGQAWPLLARLKSGRFVLFARMEERDGAERVAYLDPAAKPAGISSLTKEELAEIWDGEVILLKPKVKSETKEQTFGFGWFLGEIQKQWPVFAQIGVIAFLLHGVALSVPIFFQITLDKVLSSGSVSTLYVLTGGVCFALVLGAVLSYFRGLLVLHASSRIDIKAATRVFSKLTSLPISYFEQSASGAVAKHVSQHTQIRKFLTGKLFTTLLDLSALLIFVPILLAYSPLLTAVVFGFTVLIALVMVASMRPYQRRIRDLYKAEGERQSLLIETLQGMGTVKSLSLEPSRRRTWDRMAAHAVGQSFDVGRIGNLSSEASKLLEKLMMIAIIFVGIQEVMAAEVSIGALIAFNLLSARVSGPLVQLVSLVRDYQEAALSMKMLGEVVNRPSETRPQRALTPRINGGIEFDRVGFGFREGVSILRDVSFRIEPGSFVGVVGTSGSGKTTLFRLLQGFHYTQQGIIRIDGIDLRQIDLPHLRQAIGVVPQESFLFKGTVKENIGVTKPDASFEEIVEAARLAAAHDFIEKLPEGYDTVIEENGANLSGGQRQRIAIARALLLDPRVLILDEATSALDAESEAAFLTMLEKVRKGRTVLMSTHRLRQLKAVDQILVIEGGTVRDAGSHGELLGRCDAYSHLWNMAEAS